MIGYLDIKVNDFYLDNFGMDLLQGVVTKRGKRPN